MDLTANGKHNFSFYTDGVPVWEMKNTDGSSLSFNSIMLDQNGDNHGYMILRIPVSNLTSDNPISIKVTGSQANLTSWYMTFKKTIKTGVTINAFPAIIKNGSSQLQLVEAAIFYFGNESVAKIYADGKLVETTHLKFGYNAVNLGLKPVTKTTTIELKVIAGEFSMKNIF